MKSARDLNSTSHSQGKDKEVLSPGLRCSVWKSRGQSHFLLKRDVGRLPGRSVQCYFLL